MTKQWDTYEATIKTLYAENTLSVVRQIMIEKYGFRASTRAYRGRLMRWGVRKYKRRGLNEKDPGSESSWDSDTSTSDSHNTLDTLASGTVQDGNKPGFENSNPNTPAIPFHSVSRPTEQSGTPIAFPRSSISISRSSTGHSSDNDCSSQLPMESTFSTNTFGGSVSPVDTQSLVDDLASLVVDATGVSSLPQIALDGSLIGPMDLHHDLWAYIRWFANSIRLRSKGTVEISIADFIQTYSSDISTHIISLIISWKARTELPLPETPKGYVPISFSRHRGFILGGSGFNKLSLGIRFIRARAETATFGATRNLVESEQRRLLEILFEIEISQPRTLKVTKAAERSRFDLVKHWIEKSTHSKWDWWPLSEPKPMLVIDEVVMSWDCGCGATRQEHMSPELVRTISQSICRSPLEIPTGESVSEVESLSTGSEQPVESISTADLQSGSPNSSIDIPDSEGGPGSNATDDTHITISGLNLKYIFIIVKTSTSKLAQIEVCNMKAIEFFQALTDTYLSTRGIWRCWFSIYVYSHCDFVRVQKWNSERFAANPEFSFPPPKNLEYSYRPRPMKMNPVPPEIFKDIFYSCCSPTRRIHPFHFACQPLRNIAEEIMDRLPKRDRPVATSYDAMRLEEFWGLAAKERRSAFRVFVYLAVCISPTLAFMFAWLFGWFNDGDIQSASTPMAITLALMTLLWTVIYDGNRND